MVQETSAIDFYYDVKSAVAVDTCSYPMWIMADDVGDLILSM